LEQSLVFLLLVPFVQLRSCKAFSSPTHIDRIMDLRKKELHEILEIGFYNLFPGCVKLVSRLRHSTETEQFCLAYQKAEKYSI
jgi:hypothetical protein